MRPTALITGTSSGIGLSTSKIFLANGYRVIAAMRDINLAHPLKEYAQEIGKVDELTLLTLDVSSQASVKKAYQIVSNTQTQLDVLVNNAGFGYIGAVADMSDSEMKDQFETNFFGIHRTIKIFLPLIKQAHGAIVNVGSISGNMTFPLSSAYCASKHALEAYTEGLWMELAPLKINVYLIEPGAIETNFYTKGTKLPQEHVYTTIYRSFYSGSITTPNQRTSHRSSPDKVAQSILYTAIHRPANLRYHVGRFSFLLPMIRKLLPTEIFYWLLQKAL
ncbi:MAG: SDR family oxidoreductase [Patescibacteria group bacterium]